MLPRIKIIQVGDVHLPGTVNHSSYLDDKDQRFPAELRQAIASQPTKQVFYKIYTLLTEGEIESVLFMGDLTDVGNLDGYRATASYLANALQLGSNGALSNIQVGIVPGNHDVNRDLAKMPGRTRKFAPLTEALRAVGLPTIPTNSMQWLKVANAKANAHIALLNSCWGCGERENIPAEFRDGVSDAIEAAINKGGDTRAIKAYYDRQFDTPAFSEETIRKFAQETDGLSKGELLIACAHHNLLPQRQTRLAPYTELVNSGAFRGTLLELKRPILYLHGHIHEDPIDMIGTPDGHSLICISAPAASAGFNMLELVFTRSGLPLTCIVHRWRFDKSGILRKEDKVPISLIGTRRRASNVHLAQFYSQLLSKREAYWPDVMEIGQSIYSIDVDQEVEEAIELLLADHSIVVDNRDLSIENWIVSATI